MKKDFDITKSVMDKIVRFERRRTWLWISRFITAAGILIGVALTFLLFAAKDIGERDTLSLLSLFGEDKEIVQEFWRDTLGIFWEELPQGKLAIGIGLLIIAVILFVINRRNIKLMVKKIKNIAKYTKRV